MISQMHAYASEANDRMMSNVHALCVVRYANPINVKADSGRCSRPLSTDRIADTGTAACVRVQK